MTLQRFPEFDPKFNDNIGVRHRFTLKNYGKTPAENVQLTVTHCLKNEDRSEVAMESDGNIHIHSIAPSDAFHHNAFWGLNPEMVEKIERDEWQCVTSVKVEYEDVFGFPHELRCDFSSGPVDKEFSLVVGTRLST